MIAMRRILTNGGVLALGVLVLTFARPAPVAAQGRTIVIGETFLGIRLDKDRYSDVMARYGPPHEIQAGGPRLTDSMQPDASQTPGAPAGGAPGVPGGPGRGLPGFPGSGPGGPTPGGGFGGPPPGGGGFGAGSGSRGSNGNGDDILYTEQTETTWWYHFARKGKPTYHYAFMFNKNGRVIQIQAYGFQEGGKTKYGIGLGSSLNDVIKTYGFSTDGERTDLDKLTLRYGKTSRLAFQISNNRVLGITLGRIR